MGVVTHALPTSYLNADYKNRMLGANIALLIIPTVFVVLRTTSRFLSRAGVWVTCFAIMS